MGSINNVRVRKPHGAKSLADQHNRCRPKSVGGKLNFTVGTNKLTSTKSKNRKRSKVKTA